MPKLKTNKAVKKRFKVTRRKKVLSQKTKRRHLMGNRSPSKKRQFRRRHVLNKTNARAVRNALPYG